MQFVLLGITVVNGVSVHMSKDTGTAFIQREMASLYQDTVSTTVNMEIYAPRKQLEKAFYDNCDEYNLCRRYFEEFGTRVRSFLEQNLVVFDATPAEIMERKRRVPFLAPLAILAVSTTAVAGAALGGVNTADIMWMNENLKALNQAMEMNEKMIEIVAQRLRSNPNIVLSLKSDLPYHIQQKSIESIKDLTGGTFIRGMGKAKIDVTTDITMSHISELAVSEYDKFVTNILTLETGRLPLSPTFLLPLRTNCVAIQVVPADEANRFCTTVSFYATRMESNLRFNGVALTGEKNLIDSIVYSYTLNIPILHAVQLQVFNIVNIGRFRNGRLEKIQLANKAIVTGNGVLHPFRKNLCMTHRDNTICPMESISPYNDCLHRIYLGELAPTCQSLTEPSALTCLMAMEPEFALISQTKTTKGVPDATGAHHMYKTMVVEKFSLVNRTVNNIHIQCEESKSRFAVNHIIVPALPMDVTETIMVHQIPEHHKALPQPAVKQISNLHNIFDEMLMQLHTQQNDSKQLEKTMKLHEMGSEEISHLVNNFVNKTEDTIHNAVEKIPSWKKIIRYLSIIVGILITIIILIAIVIPMIIRSRLMKKLKKHTPSLTIESPTIPENKNISV